MARSTRTSSVMAVFCSVLLPPAALASPQNSTGEPRGESPAVSRVQQYLERGELARGEEVLAEEVKKNPRDDHARFGLATVRLVSAVERLVQSLHRHGFRPAPPAALGFIMPVPHVPAAPRPDAEKMSYAKAREFAQRWLDDLAKVESALAEIKDEGVKMPLRFGLIRLDFNGDGKADEDETLWQVYAQLNRAAQVTAEDVSRFVIAFDYADVCWLRGYCRLLMALTEIGLAYDEKELFERTAHLFFSDVETPHAFLREAADPVSEFPGSGGILDLIAYIHLINFQVKEPQRMAAAHKHLQAMVEQSRASWKAILAESDDENEWVPGPRQTGVIPGVRVTDEMVASWRDFLEELDALLAGRRLAPFWRTNDGATGVNLQRVFTEPATFDLVLWIQGTGATPYLEKGTLTKRSVWERLQRVFGGEFIGFAIWFN